MISCREATSLHTEAEEGALEGAKKLRYDIHMKICGPCQRYRAQLGTTVGVLREMPAEKPPASLVDLLAAELEKKKL